MHEVIISPTTKFARMRPSALEHRETRDYLKCLACASFVAVSIRSRLRSTTSRKVKRSATRASFVLNCLRPKKIADRAIRHSIAISESILGMKNRREDIRRLLTMIYIASDPGICRCSIATYKWFRLDIRTKPYWPEAFETFRQVCGY